MQCLKLLVALLDASHDYKTLAVACNDLGKVAEFHPRGRRLLQEVGAKDKAMKLVTHSDPAVRTQALLCVQKSLIANWGFLGSNATASAR